VEQFTSAELSIILTLVGGRKTFSELKKATGYNDRWLSNSLTKLWKRPIPVVTKKDGYSLDTKWEKDNDAYIRLLARLKSQMKFMKTDLDTMDDRDTQDLFRMFLPYFYYPLTCVMLFYQEHSLYDFLKDRATRVLWDYFDSAKKKNKHQLVDEVKNWTDPDFDLNKMTFEQCMRKFRPASDEIAYMERAVTNLLELRTLPKPWQELMEWLTAFTALIQKDPTILQRTPRAKLDRLVKHLEEIRELTQEKMKAQRKRSQ
jgi:hypothetical protein